eukprot:TRINITY_DN1738_c0_g1_i1.p1 TRINITY_DN1738_c0_g1~~TRINITY_DN1738_c0_g1_i1.p1  ORF type:complete len:542 (+),score=102.10 TRINITY_DN1738_c0_g1_i1:18-1643(+)
MSSRGVGVSLLVLVVALRNKKGLCQSIEHAIVAGVVTYSFFRIKAIGLKNAIGRVLDLLVKTVPGASGTVQKTIDEEVKKALKELLHESDLPSRTVIPKEGVDAEELFLEMKQIAKGDVKKETVFAYTYDTIEGEHEAFITRAHNIFIGANGLNPMAFPSTRKFEVEIVEMTRRMLNAPETAVGSVTTGGTESILMAVKTYRDRAEKLFGITDPEIVMPITAHPAFSKACHYFKIKDIYVPLTKDMQVDINEMRKHITSNTILLVVSSAQYPHGIVDPIPEASKLALEKGLPLHVDSCIGGFILPWIEKLGPINPFPAWDFRNPGVTSMSADMHKYGYAAKGASVVVYRSDEYRKYQYYSCSQFPGGLYLSPTMTGTRAGGPIAAAWASLVVLGEKGYLERTKVILDTVRYILGGLEEIPELAVIGKPNMSILAFKSVDPDLNIFAIADYLENEKGWKMERQQNPDCIHLTVMSRHAARKEILINDLKEGIAYIKSHPELDFNSKGSCAMYGMVAKIPSQEVVLQFLQTLMLRLYSPNPLK